MENASKALIIGGAILISMLLIGIGIVLINSTRGTTDSVKNKMASQEIQIFNAQFQAYEGKTTGDRVIELINRTIASNESNRGIKVAVRGLNIKREDIIPSKMYNVILNYSDGEPMPRNSSWFPRIEGQSGNWENLNNCYQWEVTTQEGYINYIFVYE